MAKIKSVLNQELVPQELTIESIACFKLPGVHIIGLPAKEVFEAKERILAAFVSEGISLPKKRYTISLSPGDVKKTGTELDLPMALSLLSQTNKNPLGNASVMASGELALDGRISATCQPFRLVYQAFQSESDLILVSIDSKKEIENALFEISSQLFKIKSIPMVLYLDKVSDIYIRRPRPFRMKNRLPTPANISRPHPSSVLLTPYLKRTGLIAVAGYHHCLLLGPRGTGKTQCAEWLTSLRKQLDPPINITQRLISELDPRSRYKISDRQHTPYRIASTSIRPQALTGSYKNSQLLPGELIKAHDGVLVADEYPEWSRDSREILRESLESRKTTISQVRGGGTFPSCYQFFGTGNLCPCGGVPPQYRAPDEDKSCSHCTDGRNNKYLNRISAPVIDRIDLVAVIKNQKKKSPPIINDHQNNAIDAIKQSQKIQIDQYGCLSGFLDSNLLQAIKANLHQDSKAILDSCTSYRSHNQLLKVALTIASLAGRTESTPEDFIEAYGYRPEAHQL